MGVSNQKNKSLESLANIAWAREYPEVWKLFEVLDTFDLWHLSSIYNLSNDDEISQMPSEILREDKVQDALPQIKKYILENAPVLNSDNQFTL